MILISDWPRNGRGRVADYYTRDRSTPRLDSVWVRIVLKLLSINIRKILGSHSNVLRAGRTHC